jgi:predicted nucleotidyltransferase
MADLFEHVQYRCVVGSSAYGLAREHSDTDRRGFYLPPADLHWSLEGVPEQISREPDEVYWEAGKFVRLALKANPNVLECLYSPIVETVEPIAAELLAIRHVFLSRQVHRTYYEYVMAQFRKLDRGEIRWKHAMHLIRLLLSGIAVLRDGILPLGVEEHRERLLAIRRGEVPWEEVDAWRLELHRKMDEALEQTSLPEGPDTARADAWLIRARRSAARI